jgi:hypothetical protein
MSVEIDAQAEPQALNGHQRASQQPGRHAPPYVRD